MIAILQPLVTGSPRTDRFASSILGQMHREGLTKPADRNLLLDEAAVTVNDPEYIKAPLKVKVEAEVLALEAFNKGVTINSPSL